MKIEAELYQTDLVVPEIYWEDVPEPPTPSPPESIEEKQGGGYAPIERKKNKTHPIDPQDLINIDETELYKFPGLEELEFETIGGDKIGKNGETGSISPGGIGKAGLSSEEEILLILAIAEATS